VLAIRYEHRLEVGCFRGNVGDAVQATAIDNTRSIAQPPRGRPEFVPYYLHHGVLPADHSDLARLRAGLETKLAELSEIRCNARRRGAKNRLNCRYWSSVSLLNA
jgi:hypothetical protein